MDYDLENIINKAVIFLVRDKNNLSFKDALKERIQSRGASEIIKVDNQLLIGIYRYECDGSYKFVVCDSTRSKNYIATISDRLEFDDLVSAERYYEECRDIDIKIIADQIVGRVR